MLPPCDLQAETAGSGRGRGAWWLGLRTAAPQVRLWVAQVLTLIPFFQLQTNSLRFGEHMMGNLRKPSPVTNW